MFKEEGKRATKKEQQVIAHINAVVQLYNVAQCLCSALVQSHSRSRKAQSWLYEGYYELKSKNDEANTPERGADVFFLPVLVLFRSI